MQRGKHGEEMGASIKPTKKTKKKTSTKKQNLSI
jgi:hypothetical protein